MNLTPRIRFNEGELDQLTQELYTTMDNERRNYIMRLLPTVVESEEEYVMYFTLLYKTKNIYCMQFILNLLTNSFRKRPRIFISISKQIQSQLLQIIGNGVDKSIEKSCYLLYSISVIVSWNDKSTHYHFVEQILQFINTNDMNQITLAVSLIYYIMDESSSYFTDLAFSKPLITALKDTVLLELMKILINLLKVTPLTPCLCFICSREMTN